MACDPRHKSGAQKTNGGLRSRTTACRVQENEPIVCRTAGSERPTVKRCKKYGRTVQYGPLVVGSCKYKRNYNRYKRPKKNGFAWGVVTPVRGVMGLHV